MKTAAQMIRAAGARYVGSQAAPRGTLHYFADPQTRSTLAMYEKEIKSASDVTEKMKSSRRRFSSEGKA